MQKLKKIGWIGLVVVGVVSTGLAPFGFHLVSLPFSLPLIFILIIAYTNKSKSTENQ